MSGRRSTDTITDRSLTSRWSWRRPWTPASQPYLAAAVIAAYLAFAAWILRDAQADAATTWMFVFAPEDFPTWSSVAVYLRDLRMAIPPVISLLEIANVWWTGDALFMTETAYPAALALAFLLPILRNRRSPVALPASFATAVILLTSAAAIHPGNPMVADAYFPLFILLFVASLQRTILCTGSPSLRVPLAAGAGLCLTMAELTRPFLFPIVIYVSACAGAMLWTRSRRQVIAFLIPLMVFTGGWHVHQAWRFGQLTWSNHVGFNLIRAWPMVGAVPLAPEPGNAPLAPGRDPNINTGEHFDNSQRLTGAVVQFVRHNPATAIKHAIRRVQALVIQVRTSIYSHDPNHPVFRFYRPTVWILSGLLLANVIALGTALVRAPGSALRLLAAPYNLLIAVTAYSIIVMAVGDASEEARFVISVLPLLAAAARIPWSPPDMATDTERRARHSGAGPSVRSCAG